MSTEEKFRLLDLSHALFESEYLIENLETKSAEATLCMRKLSEARFWLQQHLVKLNKGTNEEKTTA